MSIGAGEVLIPHPQKRFAGFDHTPLNIVKLGNAETSAADEPNGIQPEFCAVRITFHMNVRWLVAIGRVEEEAIRTFTMNCGRHVPVIVPSSGFLRVSMSPWSVIIVKLA
jgi:hypothetical protein